eukprot:NODE_152_length_16986_cov_0.478119.p6 type:complete len:390 gc:universal NODE_152_length_16986_cov_0.478119:2012-3181(+)
MNKPDTKTECKGIIGKDNEFARHSLLVRIPEILTGAINQLYHGQHSKEIESLGKLIYELKRNKEICPFDDDMSDLEQWNNCIKELKESNLYPMNYFDVPWLFAECYVYRKLESVVHHLDFDVFAEEKIRSLNHSLNNFKSLPAFDNIKNQCFALVLNSLWGNQMDLSLYVNMANVPIHVNNDDNLIINDFDILWPYLKTVKSGCVHFILDNVGAEFLNDLLLADFLVENNYANQVIFHCKRIPWFVSDATLVDVDVTFSQLLNHPILKDNALKWKKWRNEHFFYKSNDFWTLPYSYSQIEQRDSQLFQEISQSDLVIFKGDLNYRKLTGDSVLQDSFDGIRNIHALAIRTCKSDSLVGLGYEKRQELNAKDPKWRVNGQYGVVQYFCNK